MFAPPRPFVVRVCVCVRVYNFVFFRHLLLTRSEVEAATASVQAANARADEASKKEEASAERVRELVWVFAQLFTQSRPLCR
jgi:hypothetical protein